VPNFWATMYTMAWRDVCLAVWGWRCHSSNSWRLSTTFLTQHGQHGHGFGALILHVSVRSVACRMFSMSLFSPLGKLAGRDIYFACVNFFFLYLFFFYYEQSYLSIYWTNFHDLFTKWKVFVWIFLIRSSFSDSSGDVAMATNLVAKFWQNYLPPSLVALSFRNGIRYRYLSVRINSANNASISCKNFVNFGPVTPEKTGLVCELLFTTWPKN